MKKKTSLALGIIAVLLASTAVSMHARAAETYGAAFESFRRVGEVHAALVDSVSTDLSRAASPQTILEVFAPAVQREEHAWDALRAARPWWSVLGVGENRRVLDAALQERDGMRAIQTALQSLAETSPDAWSPHVAELRNAVQMFMSAHAVVMGEEARTK